MNKIEKCLKPAEVCDIDVDCDEKEDELLNCGEWLIEIYKQFN